MSPDVVAKPHAAVRAAASTEVMRKRFDDEGAEEIAGSPADFGVMLKSELDLWRKVVVDGNLWLD
jgi:tripartite-type tricarboxylate transporter receptor subunit TctC